jgi:hypothetical protein
VKEKRRGRRQRKKLRRRELQHKLKEQRQQRGKMEQERLQQQVMEEERALRTSASGKSASTTDPDDIPAGETFGVLMVVGTSRSLPSTSNTDETPIGEMSDMLTSSAMAAMRMINE